MLQYLDGSLLKMDEIIELVSSEYRQAVQNDRLISISQGEHPYLGVAFYHIHPCRTQDIMSEIHTANYILRL